MPLQIIEKYTDIFVETGTFYGDGIQFALNSGYEKVISIELVDKFYEIGKQRFINNNKVEIVKGDSGVILGDIINKYHIPITFWLDGHFSGGDTGLGVKEFPILEELEFIKNHDIKKHVILIDDVRCWKSYSNILNFDSVVDKLLSINKDYSFYFLDGYIKNDILLIKCD